jgi:hypothetical protein
MPSGIRISFFTLSSSPLLDAATRGSLGGIDFVFFFSSTGLRDAEVST